MKRVWFIIALVMIGGGACSTESGFDKDAKKILAGYSTPQKELAAAINAAKNDFPTATGLYQPDAWMLRQKGRDVEIWLVITGEDNIKHDTYYTLKKILPQGSGRLSSVGLEIYLDTPLSRFRRPVGFSS